MSTLAEQVVEQLKTDMDNVYDAGYQKGKSEGGGYDFSKARYLRFFDMNPFNKAEVVLNIGYGNYDDKYLDFMMSSYIANTTVKHLTLNVNPEISRFTCNFYNGGLNDNTMEHITFNAQNAKLTTGSTIFYNLRALKVIDGTPFDFSEADKNSIELVGCNALEEIRFAPNTMRNNFWFGNSQYLSDESIQSIVDGFADMTGQTSPILTVHPDVKAKIEANPTQLATLTSKNVTLA